MHCILGKPLSDCLDHYGCVTLTCGSHFPRLRFFPYMCNRRAIHGYGNTATILVQLKVRVSHLFQIFQGPM